MPPPPLPPSPPPPPPGKALRFQLEISGGDRLDGSGFYRLISTDRCDSDWIFQVNGTRFLFYDIDSWILAEDICDLDTELQKKQSLADIVGSIPISASGRTEAIGSNCSASPGGPCSDGPASARSATNHVEEAQRLDSACDPEYRRVDPSSCRMDAIFSGEDNELHVFELDGFWTLGPAVCSGDKAIMKAPSDGSWIDPGLAWVDFVTGEPLAVNLTLSVFRPYSPPPPMNDSGGGVDGLSIGIIAGVVAGVVVAIIAACLCLFFLRELRRVVPVDKGDGSVSEEDEDKRKRR
uniref:Uncharacterized protein n=1 Tax=Tetraselmis sp. GSL018 TaxID=582737 RepID=A0A061RF51_9CHLO